MTDEERITELRRLLPLHNEDQMGVDSTKRALAIELLVGPASMDRFQTDRLCVLALSIATAKEGQYAQKSKRVED